jgi:hypothetical protein
VKRSKSIRLVLIGGLSAGALTSCGPASRPGPDSLGDNVFTNDHQLPGGYYHAPYRAWYPLPYNHYNAQTRRYFHGGQWTQAPHESITNLSPPTLEAAQRALAQQAAAQTPVQRSGFGSTAQRHHVYS